MRSNSGRDYLSQTSLAMGALQYLGGAKIDSYNVPMSASGDWWQNLKVRDICVVGGEYEMFIDDIEAWTKIVKVRAMIELEYHFPLLYQGARTKFASDSQSTD